LSFFSLPSPLLHDAVAAGEQGRMYVWGWNKV